MRYHWLIQLINNVAKWDRKDDGTIISSGHLFDGLLNVFIMILEGKMADNVQVEHIDGDLLNNTVINLRLKHIDDSPDW